MFEAAGRVLDEIMHAHATAKLARANEATTRLRVIDRMLFDVLGWDRNVCIAEQPEEGDVKGFLDYALVVDKSDLIVVEAKRAGATFEIPKEKKNRQYRVDTLLSFCGKRLQEVINQARDYAVNRGIPWAVATNGLQWIIFRPHIPHQPWREGTAIVFRDLNDVRENLSLFFELSPQAVIGGQLDARLQVARRSPPRFAKSFNDTRGNDPGKGDNDLARSFNGVFSFAFDSIVDLSSDEMLRTCYVASDASRSYNREFASLLQRARPKFLPTETKTAIEDGAPHGELVDLVAAQTRPCVVLLVGNVGAGKTTFLHHFLRVYLPSKSKDPIRWVIRDLKNDPVAMVPVPDLAEAERRIFDALLGDIEKRFPEIDPYQHDVQRHVFDRELSRLSRGARREEFKLDPSAKVRAEANLLSTLTENSKTLAIALLRYVRDTLGHPLCVAFDNVDRGSEKFQQFIYTLAHRLAEEAGCIALVTMRQQVYESARESGFLDVRNDIVFEVLAPSLTTIFSRRLKYARRMMQQSRPPALRNASSQELDRITSFLEVINELALGDTDPVRRMLEACSAGNIRNAFRFLQRFATSGHVDVSRLITVYNRSRFQHQRPSFSLRDFMRPFILGNFHRYHSRQAPLANVFEVPAVTTGSHFLRLRVLSFLLERYRGGAGKGRGETLVSEVIAALAHCGHLETDTVNVCIDLARSELVERVSSTIKALTRDDLLRISAAGAYYVTDLMFDEDYLFYISQDTVVYDEDYHRSIDRAHRAVETGRGARQAVIGAFLDYLHKRESKERTTCGAARAPTIAWDRMFSIEIGRILVGGPAWEPQPVPEVEDAAPPVSSESTRRFGRTDGQLEFSGVLEDRDENIPEAIRRYATEIGALEQDTQLLGSRQFARVLWGLGVAQRSGAPPASAAEIARVVREHARIDVEPTNVARFFRTQFAQYRPYLLRVDERRYGLTAEGAALFQATFAGRARRTSVEE